MAHRSIERYLSGKMSAKETEAFWVFLLENPDFLDHLHLDANLRHMAASDPEKFKALMAQAESEIYAEELAESETAINTAKAEPVSYKATPDMADKSAVPTFSIKPYYAWIAAAAAVLLLVWSLNLLRVSSQTGTDSRLALVERLGIPQEADYILFEPLASLRNDSTADPVEEIIDQSLLLAFSGSYEQALELYDEVIEFFPDDPRVAVVYLNKGLTLYNMERWTEAVSAFERTLSFDLSDVHQAEKAYWFKANAYIHQGLLFRALRPLRLVAEMPGQFGNDAWEYLSLMRPHLLDEYIFHLGGDFDFDTFDGYEFLEDVDLD